MKAGARPSAPVFLTCRDGYNGAAIPVGGAVREGGRRRGDLLLRAVAWDGRCRRQRRRRVRATASACGATPRRRCRSLPCTRARARVRHAPSPGPGDRPGPRPGGGQCRCGRHWSAFSRFWPSPAPLSLLILAFFLSFFSPLAPLPASQVKQPRPLVECVGVPASYPKTRQAGSVGCSRPGGAGACQGALVCAGRVERERAGLCAWPPLSVCSAGVAPRPPRLASQLPTRPRVELAVRHS